jgi:hypothetical protein
VSQDIAAWQRINYTSCLLLGTLFFTPLRYVFLQKTRISAKSFALKQVREEESGGGKKDGGHAAAH